MFPSSLGSLIPQSARRTNFHVASTLGESNIHLNFEDYGPKRKSSFLPSNLKYDYSSDKFISIHSSVYRPSRFDPTTRKIEEFCTGSKYLGEHNRLGIARKGLYKYPHGVIYDGFFNKNGEFHGTGSLIYPSGQRVEGIWRDGKLIDGASCVTPDGTPYSSQYCRMPDRRFQIEIVNDLQPAGQEYLTNANNPPRQIRPGCYDAGEGFYMPKDKLIYDYHDSAVTKSVAEFAESHDPNQREMYREIIGGSKSEEFAYNHGLNERKISRLQEVQSIPSERKEKWIIENCRRAWDEPTGFQPKLYEVWTTGKSEICKLIRKNESKTRQDKLIESMAKLDNIEKSSAGSLLISFIITVDSQNFIDSTKAMINKMLLPRELYRAQSRNKIKRKLTYLAKKIKRHSSKGVKKNKISKDNSLITFTRTPKQRKRLKWKL